MPGKLSPQTPLEMRESEQARRSGSKLYKQASAEFVDQQIGGMVEQMGRELERAGKAEPVSLSDIDRVIATTLDYVSACAEASTIPNTTGLARSLGITRQAVYDTIHRNSPKQAARWFSLCKDCFSELLGNASLRNGVNSIVSIFLLKSLYGYKESHEVIIQNGQAQALTDEDRQEMAAQLMSKYGDLPED